MKTPDEKSNQTELKEEKYLDLMPRMRRPVNLISQELLKYMTEDHFLNFIKQR